MTEMIAVENGSMGRVAYRGSRRTRIWCRGRGLQCLAEGSGTPSSAGRSAASWMRASARSTAGISRSEVRASRSSASPARCAPATTALSRRRSRVSWQTPKHHGGPFVAGSNPICMTFEVTLEEWLPALAERAVRSFGPRPLGHRRASPGSWPRPRPGAGRATPRPRRSRRIRRSARRDPPATRPWGWVDA